MIHKIRVRRGSGETVDPLLQAAGVSPVLTNTATAAAIRKALEARDLSQHWLVFDRSDESAELALRYGKLLARPVMSAGSSRARGASRPRSVTFVVPFHVPRLPEWIVAQRQWLERVWGFVPPTAFVAARAPDELSRVLAKQLVQLSRPDTAAGMMAILDNHPLNDSIDPAGLQAHKGPLFVYGHARPHCGKTVQRKPIVLCSSASEGQDGLCVDSTHCAFPRDQKVALRRLETTRLFFDACSTATLGLHDLGMPATLNHATAAFSGHVREFIGNLTVTAVDDAEYDWFTALSALGFSPATIIEVLNRRRIDKRREGGVSLVYFGDGAHGPWPCGGPAVSCLDLSGRAEATIDCRGADLIAARIAEQDDAAALEERISLVSSDAVEGTIEQAVFRVPGTKDGAIVLRGDLSRNPTITLALHRERQPREVVGPRLEAAVREIRWLETLPAFRKHLEGASRRLEVALVELTRARDAMYTHGALAPTMADLASVERTLACKHDTAILGAALARARKPWDVEESYSRFGVPPARSVRCMHCRGKAWLVHLRSPLGVLRRQLECPRCFIVYVVPVWPLEAKLLSQPVRRGRTLETTFGLRNTGHQSRVVSVALHVDGSVRASRCVTPIVKEIEHGEQWSVDLRYECKEVPDNFRRSKMFIASEGTFGYYAISKFFWSKRDDARG
jgi:hypothetical protein